MVPTHPTIRRAILQHDERELRRRVRHAHHATPRGQRDALRLRAVVLIARALRLGVAVERRAEEPATVLVRSGCASA